MSANMPACIARSQVEDEVREEAYGEEEEKEEKEKEQQQVRRKRRRNMK